MMQSNPIVTIGLLVFFHKKFNPASIGVVLIHFKYKKNFEIIIYSFAEMYRTVATSFLIKNEKFITQIRIEFPKRLKVSTVKLYL